MLKLWFLDQSPLSFSLLCSRKLLLTQIQSQDRALRRRLWTATPKTRSLDLLCLAQNPSLAQSPSQTQILLLGKARRLARKVWSLLLLYGVVQNYKNMWCLISSSATSFPYTEKPAPKPRARKPKPAPAKRAPTSSSDSDRSGLSRAYLWLCIWPYKFFVLFSIWTVNPTA